MITAHPEYSDIHLVGQAFIYMVNKSQNTYAVTKSINLFTMAYDYAIIDKNTNSLVPNISEIGQELIQDVNLNTILLLGQPVET